MSFDMDDLPLAQGRDGLSANECYPQQLVNDPSFALLNRDPYVIRNGVNALWAVPPTPQLINGRNPPFRRRDLSNEYVLEDTNSSRRLDQDELDLVAETIALDEHLRMLDGQMHEVAAYVDCVGDVCATSTTLISKYVFLPLFVMGKKPFIILRQSFLLTKNKSTNRASVMTLLPSMPTGTIPHVVDATATAVKIALDHVLLMIVVALCCSGAIFSAAPEVTGLV